MTYRPGEDAETLRSLVRDFLAKHSSESAVRSTMESDLGYDLALWRRLGSELGLQGLTVPAAYGGSGASLVELGVAFEELGRALACVPFLSTVALAATAIEQCGGPAEQAELLPAIAEGGVVATLAWAGPDPASSSLSASSGADTWRISGTAPQVLDGATADVILVAAGTDLGPTLFVVEDGAAGVSREPLTTLDQTRRLSRLVFNDAPVRPVSPIGEARPGLECTLDVATLLLAAEQLGGATRVLESAVSYASTRMQFGRVIGSFQAVKHRCADMLVEIESCRSVVEHGLWAATVDPAELPISASLARAVTAEAFTWVAEQNIQIHGGIGFTWEHDAHLFLKRAKSSQLLFDSARRHRARLGALLEARQISPVIAGIETADNQPAGGDISPLAGEVADLLRRNPVTQTADRNLRAARFDEGLAVVSFDLEFGGRALPASLQADVDRLFSDAGCEEWFDRNVIGLGMALPTLHEHGTPAQRQRYLKPCFTGEEIWCQLFSEPGAGSDLASLATRAVADGDDFVVNGQKVWTSLGHVANFGILLARTDPDIPKHKGLTFFILDMSSPGVEVKPLRQLTGEAEFNEVYLTDVRIPKANVVGEVGQGWSVAMTTLANERVSLGRRAGKRGEGPIAQAVEIYVGASARGATDEVMTDRLVQLWVRAEAARLTNLRASSRADQTPGPEGSIAKLQMAELNQAIYAFCIDESGAEGLLIDSYEETAPVATSVHGASDVRKAYLRSRANSIEGGTSEILRNILGERVLGLPGEPRVDREVALRSRPPTS